MERFARNSEALFSQLGDDVVALNVARGECYGMSDVTAAVWTMLAVPITTADICSQLMTRYDVDERRCFDDIAELLAEMVAKGLVNPA